MRVCSVPLHIRDPPSLVVVGNNPRQCEVLQSCCHDQAVFAPTPTPTSHPQASAKIRPSLQHDRLHHDHGKRSLLEAPPRQASPSAPEAGAERGRAPVHGGPYAAPGPPCWGTSGQHRAPEAALHVPAPGLWHLPVPTGGRLCEPPGTPRSPEPSRPRRPWGWAPRQVSFSVLLLQGCPTPHPTPLARPVSISLCFQPKAKSSF